MTDSRNQRRAFARRLKTQFDEAFRLLRVSYQRGTIGLWLARAFPHGPTQAIPAGTMPLKDARLAELDAAGYNVADWRSWHRGTLNEDELRAFFERHGSISLRNFREERRDEQTPKLPVLYEQSSWPSVLEFCREHNRVHHTLVNQAIPLSATVHAGNIILVDDDRYVVSCFSGYGTPRDVDANEGRLQVYMRRYSDAHYNGMPSDIAQVAKQFRSFRTDFRPMTIEFSTYRTPVGKRGERALFWEWRSGTTHDLYTVIGRLLEKAPSGSIILDVPNGKTDSN